MPPCGTFDYVAAVPSAPVDGVIQVRASLREPVERRGKSLTDNRLVGWSPRLEISSLQVILEAEGRQLSQLWKATFAVDPGFMPLLEPGDVVHLTRTGTADLGLSVLRGDGLVVAFGAVTAVPLGSRVSVSARVRNTASFFESRRRSTEDVESELEVSVGDETVTLKRGGSARVGRYAVSVLRCFEWGVPGRYECVALGTTGEASTAAYHCALLMASERTLGGGPIEMTRWDAATPEYAIKLLAESGDV
jgi:hypothetical protein